MFHERKFIVVEVLLLLQFLFIQNEIIVEASIRSGKPKATVHNEEDLKEQQSNQISVEAEEKGKSEDNQLYYLPTQTVFDQIDTLEDTGGLTSTSPPHLNINPAPIQTDYQENTILHKDSSADAMYYSGPYQSQCVSETPVIELESRFLLPSKDAAKESVIMSGHVEIASKTSSFDEISEIGNMVSKPSIALQGTVLHSHTISDL